MEFQYPFRPVGRFHIKNSRGFQVTIFHRNNLAKAVSSYLRQHQDNPIWWQEWNGKAIAYARTTGKLLFVSVGYAACHWCHVMAKEAFSDPETAAYLNRYFVSIKIDREQRPDIDHYLMSFLAAIQGQGGWPLNAFLTPDLQPVYAMTYAPVKSRDGMTDFLYILKEVKKFHEQNPHPDDAFSIPAQVSAARPENELSSRLKAGFDSEYGGYGEGQKFPSFCTLLFTLAYGDAVRDHELIQMCVLTLDRIALGGLHDHLQGGFFRYCVDREWTMPHFEKMLYDQAMALWVYSLAFKISGKSGYREVAEKIIRCLDETFSEKGLYLSALDADTNHQEGATYLWEEKELRALLTPEEFERFCAVYDIQPGGNFEGKNHLIKKREASLAVAEEKLLLERKKRLQPKADKKLITSWNALAGIGFIHAYRFLGRPDCRERAVRVARELLKQHVRKGRLAHSSCGKVLQREEFLQDVSGLLLLLTCLQEEDGAHGREIRLLERKLRGYKKRDTWIESRQNDFKEIRAEMLDQPVPSSASLAEFALLRIGIMKSLEIQPGVFREPRQNDFYNYAILARNGFFHIFTTPEILSWQSVPALSIQVKGEKFRDCYQGSCHTALPSLSHSI